MKTTIFFEPVISESTIQWKWTAKIHDRIPYEITSEHQFSNRDSAVANAHTVLKKYADAKRLDNIEQAEF